MVKMSSCITRPLAQMASRVCRKDRPSSSMSLRGRRAGRLRTFSRSKTHIIQIDPQRAGFRACLLCFWTFPPVNALASHDFFKCVAGCFEAVLSGHFVLHFEGAFTIAWIAQETGDHSGGALGGVVFALHYFGYAEAADAAGVVRLVVAVGHHDHRLACAQR